MIGGHSETGIGNTSDLMWNLLKGVIQLGAAPDDPDPFDVAPVDYVAGALVSLSLQEGCLNQNFHFPNPDPMIWDQAHDFIEAFGYPLRRLTFERWIEELGDALELSQDNALAPFAPMVMAGGAMAPVHETEAADETFTPVPRESRFPTFDTTNTDRGLEGTGIVCPAVDEKLMRVYFEHFIETGFFAPLPTSATAVTAELDEDL